MADAAPTPDRPADQSWTSGAKDAVTAAIDGGIWVTVGQGVVNEIFWPAVDQPQVKDFGFLIRDVSAGEWREVKAVGTYTVTPHQDAGIPLCTVRHSGDFYELSLEIVPDPAHDALLVRFQLQRPPGSEPRELRLYPLLAPHLGTSTADLSTVYGADGARLYGADNSACVEDGFLLARDGADAHALCLAARPGFAATSVGYVGASDGWTDLYLHGEMAWKYTSAGPGVVALTGELIAPTGALSGTLAVGFGTGGPSARAAAQAALDAGVDAAVATVEEQWRTWLAALTFPPAVERCPELAPALRQSAAVLRMNRDHRIPGAIVAGLATPWGDQTNDPGGYHMIWCRDGCESALALAALGDLDTGVRFLDFLAGCQNDDGSWARCYFVDGTPMPGGVQLDEVAFPVLLAAKLAELHAPLPSSTAGMVEKAVGCLLRLGPTGVDRWEETPGTSPFSLAVTIAALVAAAQTMRSPDKDYVLSVADNWNERLEEFTYVSGSLVDRHFGTAGHYVRIGPAADPVRLGNQPPRDGQDTYVPAERMVGLEFLYLPRLGLRDTDDHRLTDTLVVVDRMLKRQTPSGEAFLRYDMDGYGEWIDGSGWPVREYGIGRPWPLLCGERGHFEVLTGADPVPRLLAMLSMRGRGGLLPEQVWDADELPWRNLAPGQPTGSAMPLAWAHSELIKLAVTATSGNGRPVEWLKAVEEYYPDRVPRETLTWHWRDNGPVRRLPADCALVVESTREFTLHYGFDQWQPATIADQSADAQPFGLWGVRLAPEMLKGHSTLQFTRRYPDGSWDGTDIAVVLGESRPLTAELPLPPREFAGR